jgi:hypothetical protein
LTGPWDGPVRTTLKADGSPADVQNMLVVSQRAARAGSPHDTPVVDRGDIVLGWLTRLTVIMALVGVALFDAISVGTTTANVADQGTTAALAASATWDETKNVQAAYDSAVASVTEQNAQNELDPHAFSIDADGTVHLTVSRDAKTLVLYRWGKTAKWAHVSQTAQGRSVAD